MRGDELTRKLAESNGKASNRRPASKPAARTSKAAQKEEEPPPRKPPEQFETYYESGRSCFWTKNANQEWQRFTTDELGCMLRVRGFSTKSYDGYGASEADRFIHQIRFERSVNWAGELGGWPAGVHQVGGSKILITRGYRSIRPKRGPYPLIRNFLKTLLPSPQLSYFLGWLKGSLDSLDEGFPFRPGQLVAFCGPVNCGKSFAQTLVTEVLGGRKGDPTDYLLGNTAFTGDFFKAEHLAIEDRSLRDFSSARRRTFAANLKGLVVNSEQRIHPKGKEAFLLPVGTRITLSCNDAPAALAILPALDVDVADKVLYFLCEEGELPMRNKKSMTRAEQYAAIIAELPAFLWYLRQIEIPRSLRDKGNRFTVRAWHHETIVNSLDDLEPHQRLLQLLEVLELPWPSDGVKKGTAPQIEHWMRKVDVARQLDRLLTYDNAMGVLLSKIAKDDDPRVKIKGKQGRHHVYLIYKDEL